MGCSWAGTKTSVQEGPLTCTIVTIIEESNARCGRASIPFCRGVKPCCRGTMKDVHRKCLLWPRCSAKSGITLSITTCSSSTLTGGYLTVSGAIGMAAAMDPSRHRLWKPRRSVANTGSGSIAFWWMPSISMATQRCLCPSTRMSGRFFSCVGWKSFVTELARPHRTGSIRNAQPPQHPGASCAGRTTSFGTRQGPHPQMCSATSTGSSSRTGAHCISIFSSGSRMSPRYQSIWFIVTFLGRTASWRSWCRGHQKLAKGALHLKNTPTEFVNRQGNKVLELYHPSDAFALNLRAYIMSLLPALKCRMDVQTTDGRSMLLRYVTNYVTKWQDAYSDNALYSMHLTSSTCLFSTQTTFLNTSCSTTYTGVWLSWPIQHRSNCRIS